MSLPEVLWKLKVYIYIYIYIDGQDILILVIINTIIVSTMLVYYVMYSKKLHFQEVLKNEQVSPYLYYSLSLTKIISTEQCM